MLGPKRRVAMTRAARRDIREIQDHYEEQVPDLGQRFMTYFVRALEQISERPNSFPMVYLEARRAILRVFPYGVYFRDLGPHLEVFAISHLSRNPSQWRRRI
jgi:plasmid stabilization system protein ParE